jgi:hypothetical protein
MLLLRTPGGPDLPGRLVGAACEGRTITLRASRSQTTGPRRVPGFRAVARATGTPGVGTVRSPGAPQLAAAAGGGPSSGVAAGGPTTWRRRTSPLLAFQASKAFW